MTEIIPGILVHNLKELKEKRSLLHWAPKVHVDIMDGKFVPNKTIQPLTLKKALPKMIHIVKEFPDDEPADILKVYRMNDNSRLAE